MIHTTDNVFNLLALFQALAQGLLHRTHAIELSDNAGFGFMDLETWDRFLVPVTPDMFTDEVEKIMPWYAATGFPSQKAAAKALKTRHCRELLFGSVEVSTDGRTTWVNHAMCLARHCPVSGEVLDAGGHLVTVAGESFEDWALRVENAFFTPSVEDLVKIRKKALRRHS